MTITATAVSRAPKLGITGSPLSTKATRPIHSWTTATATAWSVSSEGRIRAFTGWVAQTARDTGQTPAEVVLSLADRHGLSRYDYNVLSLATVM